MEEHREYVATLYVVDSDSGKRTRYLEAFGSSKREAQEALIKELASHLNDPRLKTESI